MATPSNSFSPWLRNIAEAVEIRLSEILSINAPSPVLLEGMRYAVLDGGKRLRPAVVFAITEEISGHALDAACALELIHCYSLVHDDLPCMDNDDMRRNRLACHKVYGDGMALLIGDCLQSLAFQTISRGHLPMIACHHLALASGVVGIGGGQALDILGAEDTIEAIKTMHHLKTGSLFSCALQLGLLCRKKKKSEDEQALFKFGQAFSLLFQIANDIQDIEQDKKMGKMTYATINSSIAPEEAVLQAQREAVVAVENIFPRLADIARAVYSP